MFSAILDMVAQFVILLLASLRVDTLDWQEVVARKMIFLGLSPLLVLTRLRPTLERLVVLWWFWSATAGESVGILGLRQVIESDVARYSLIHESSLARSCADVGASSAGVSVSVSAALCVAALPAGRSLTYAQVAAKHVERWRVLAIRVVWTRLIC